MLLQRFFFSLFPFQISFPVPNSGLACYLLVSLLRSDIQTMRRVENPNAPHFTRQAGTYSRLSLDGHYTAWYAPVANTVVGHAFKSWSMAPNALAGSGTIHREEDAARRAVDYFMDVSVARQREERAGHTLPTDRLEYVNGVLTVIASDPQYNDSFVAPEKPDTAFGSVGSVEAVTNGLG